MSDNTERLWGITGLMFPWAIRNAEGEVIAHGTWKLSFTHGASPEKLTNFDTIAEKIGANLQNLVLQGYGLQGYGPLSAGDTFERISIADHKRLEAEDEEEAEKGV